MWVRLLAAAAVLVSAAVHLSLWFDGVRDQHVVGTAFMVNAVAGTVIAVLLVVWPHWLPSLLAAGFGASTFGAFVLATTVGLFGVHDHWVGTAVWTAAVAEVVALVAGLVVLVRENPLASGQQLEHWLPVRRAHLH